MADIIDPETDETERYDPETDDSERYDPETDETERYDTKADKTEMDHTKVDDTETADANVYLECEQAWVYDLLITAAGWFGAYTFIMRGGVFCNAQTANVVLFAIALGEGDFKLALYLAFAIGAYFMGAFVSEYLGKSVKRLHFLRWDTMLIGIEIFVVVLLGLLPAKAPDQICQIALNFICSMQFNTFRQVKGVPAATTFVTNHIRQVGHFMAKYVRHHNSEHAERVMIHGRLLLFFVIGAVLSTIACRLFAYRSIWGSAIILVIIFIELFHADRYSEKNLLEKVPHGH